MRQTKGVPFIAIVAMIIGIVLIISPTTALSLIMFIIGALMIISSIASITEYYRLKNKGFHPSAIMVASGVTSGLLGLLLVISPLLFVGFLLTMLAILMVLGSISQLISLFSVRNKGVAIPWGLLVTPLSIFFIGAYMLIRPIDSAATITSLFGVGLFIFATVELISYYIKRKYSQE